nr:zinc-type alcohol dehydrogenase-like protein [Quercus suber]
MAPSTQKRWTVTGKTGFDDLKLATDAPVPQIGDKDVLVKFHAASLNYRDLIITKGLYPFAQREGVVPGSDGAGEVVQVGKGVHRFKEGDKVLTLFNQAHIAGSLDAYSITTGVGGMVDGSLQQYGAYDEQGLVHMPSNLNYLEGSTLTCAAVTAWNALYGIKSRELLPGNWVLTQGTGGVSIFGVQFAKAAGARVIATTSSAEKGERLKQLGADHVINYKEDTNWGETAKKLTGGVGVQHVIEVGGPNTMKQSLKAIAIDGVIGIIGFLGGVKGEKQPSYVDCLTNVCTVRGVYVGSRLQFEEMNRAIEANNIKPVVDKTVFKLDDTKDAYQYMWDQKHFGKVAISIE